MMASFFRRPARRVAAGMAAGVLAAGLVGVVAGTAPAQATALTPKLLFVGIDGAGEIARVDAANAPNLDALRAQGTWGSTLLYSSASDSDWGQKGAQTLSGPGWSTMLTGVWPAKHHVVDNTFSGKQYATYPSFIDRIEQVSPSLRTAAFATWSPLVTNVTAGGTILHADTSLAGGPDATTAQAGVNALADPATDVVFVALDDVDHAGHTYGANSTQFTQAIEAADARLGQLLAAVNARPTRASEQWTIIVTADHGHKPTGGHGGATIPERSTYVIVAGDGVPAGYRNDIQLADAGATALSRMGITINPAWGLDGVPVGSHAADAFDGLRPSLLTRSGETGIPTTVKGYTHTPPAGWSVDNSAMPTGGMEEWKGWTFTTQDFWSRAQASQARENALLVRDVFAVADSDEWDDVSHGSGAFDSTLLTPQYPVTAGQTVKLSFFSDFRAEGSQTGRVSVRFNGGTATQLAALTTTSENGLRTVTATVPAGATNAQFLLRYTGTNNWYWAVDDFKVTTS
ncbi:type I phosphodiesterase/nucleotide pyrophosphatase [Parafrankia sp. EUN1f]|nr:type I phosphodiesterase/nucleotide pyrophosphatase [Parafrankia sp. EUN1f]